MKLAGVLVCLLLVLMIPVTSDNDSRFHSQTHLSDSYEDYLEIEMLPDVELNSNYNTSENDNHNAFEANPLLSEVELRWSHSDGVQLDYREPSDFTSNLPDCEEYVYVSEDFTWDYNVLPSQASARIEYAVNLVGDFDTISWPILYHLYAWIIDSSGKWTNIYSSTTGMSLAHATVSIGISYEEVSRAWGGMIENDDGNQTDPTDTLRFAIGLGPSYQFANHDSEYWNWMNGVVQILVDSMSLTCIVNPTPDDEVTLEPDYVVTKGTTFNDITSDIAIMESGEIYSIGTSYSEISTLTLTKWTTAAEVSWSQAVHGEDSWSGIGLAITDSAVVTVGSATVSNETDTLIAKWNHQGILLWNKTFDLGRIDHGFHVDIAHDGSIFVVGSYLGENTYSAYLARFADNGTLLWVNRDFPYSDDPWDVAVATDGYVYSATRHTIAKWDIDGTQMWNRTGVFGSVKVTREGNLYTTAYFHPTNVLQQWNTNGTKGWNVTLTYNHTYFGETYLYPVLIDVSPAGWAYVRLSSARGIGIFILAIFDTEGLLLWNQTISPDYIGYPYYRWYDGAAGVHSSGFVCFAPSILTSRGDIDICLQLYLTDRVAPITTSPLTIVLIVVAIVIVVAIPLDYIRRKRSFAEDEEPLDWMTTQVYLAS